MKDSVSCIFKYANLYYIIKRQNFLRVFPGYTAPPGGKVDAIDHAFEFSDDFYPQNVDHKLIHALIREINEELDFNISSAIKDNIVKSIDYLGMAITPEYNPYRFKNHYFLVNLSQKIDFNLDINEAEYGSWLCADELLSEFQKGEMLIVEAALRLFRALNDFEKNNLPIIPQDFSNDYDSEKFVPELESLFGVKQFLPLSHTFPPANRTNCFLIGDTSSKRLLIDPSPIDESELNKLINSINKYGIDEILITHHHKDHWEFSNVLAKKFNAPMMMSQYTFDKIGKNYFEGITVKIIKEGDIVTTSLNSNVLVYEVPGHDEGQIALAPDDMRWFLAGDLIQTVGTVVIGGLEGDMSKYFHSLNRVIDLNPKFIIPSHGIIIGGTNKLKETLEHRRIRENQIIELLDKNKTIDEMLDIVYVGLKSELLPYAKKTIEAHIKKINQDRITLN